MKKFFAGLVVGFLLGMNFSPEPEPEVYCAESMTCSAAKVAASKVCDCQIVCYEDSRSH